MAYIVILGINHYDPLGRSKIAQFLTENKETFIPDCIAVEWKQSLAKVVISQREDLRELLKTSFPILGEKDLTLLANSIAFESDSHISIYPDLPIIWLDNYRDMNENSEIIKNYAHDRYNILSSIINKGYYDCIEISKQICNQEYEEAKATERDQLFNNTIKQIIKNKEYNNIICVVGVNHSYSRIEGVFANLLIKDGNTVKTVDLTKTIEE